MIDNIIKNATQLIKELEGFRAYEYIDIAGNTTIGFGFTKNNTPEWDEIINGNISCNTVLFNKISNIYIRLKKYYPALENHPYLFVIFISFSYNLGLNWTMKSTNINKYLSKYLDCHDNSVLPLLFDTYIKYCHVEKKVIPGLYFRRIKEIAFYLNNRKINNR